MATLTIMGSGASNGNMVETYMPYATYKSAAVVSVETGSDVGICSSSKTIMWDKSAIPTNDSGWYVFTTKQDLWIDLSADTVVVTTRDPAAPPGDHNTLIDGTAYEIDGGRVLIGGTAYSIDKGKTMVDGTVREIAFSSPITVNITGKGNATYAYVTVDGVTYTKAATLEVNQGATIIAYVKTTASNMIDGEIIMNGSMVADADSGVTANYSFVANMNTVNINLEYLKHTTSSGKKYYGGRVTITTS